MPVNGKPSNPFHIHEYTPDELQAELSAYFTIDKFLGQSLDERIRIPPFYEAQRRLPKDAVTQIRLFGWKAFNKIPLAIREWLSGAIWGKPFYPTEMDYNFDEDTVRHRTVLCSRCAERSNQR